MEIEIELDNGFICDFEPDFRVQTNTTDQAKVSWRLSGRNVTVNVGILCPELPTKSTTDSTIFGRTDVRLLP